MREFARCSEADYQDLENLLSDGQLYIYKNRELPPGCLPSRTRVGFEKDGPFYVLYIDNGISTTIQDPDFAAWIQTGVVRFASLDDMEEFWHRIGTLFGEPVEAQCIEDHHFVIDRERLHAIQKESNQPRTVWPEEIAQQLKQQIYGQEEAINQLAEGIALNRMKRRARPYVALLLGPPATGKTDTAKNLAEVLSTVYEQDYGFIHIDCNTYRMEHSVQSLLGAPLSYTGSDKPTPLEAVRVNPFTLILFDEVEKAHENLLVALMQALDQGELALNNARPAIDLTHCIILFTSNLAIDMKAYERASDYERDEMLKDRFTEYCHRPEISRRITDYMVFRNLDDDAAADVLIKFTQRALDDYGARLHHIDEELVAAFLSSKTKYGATEIDKRISRAIGKYINTRHDIGVIRGKYVDINGTPQNIEIDVVGNLQET